MTNFTFSADHQDKTIIMKRPIGFPSGRYSEDMLKLAIQKVLVHFNGANKGQEMTQILIGMVDKAVKSVMEFRNDLDVLDGRENVEVDEYCRAFCLAVLFYLGYFEREVDGQVDSFVDLRGCNILAVIQQTNSFGHHSNLTHDSILISCKNELDTIAWWINKGLQLIKAHRGECTRLVYVQSQKEKEYYQPGKVFRTQNVISAYKGPFGKSIAKNYEE